MTTEHKHNWFATVDGEIACDGCDGSFEDYVAAAEKLAKAVEVLREAMYSDDKGAAYEALWSALAHWRELCPVTAQDARETEKAP